MQNQKKRICKKAVFPAVLCLCLLMGGAVLAWLVGSDQKVNTFYGGEVEVTVEEDYTPPSRLDPGTIIDKKPRILNTGNLPCYVRMRADFSSSELEAAAEVDWNVGSEKKWEAGGDGYYYYKELVQPGKYTENLFTTVTIKADADPLILKDFEIYIYAEAVQEEEGYDYRTVWEVYTGGGRQ